MAAATHVSEIPALTPDEQLRRLQENALEMTHAWIAAEWGPTSTTNFRAFIVTLLSDIDRLPQPAPAPP